MSNFKGFTVCSVCSNQIAQELPTERDGRHINCSRCGQFFISGTAAATVENWPVERRMNVSGWIREKNIVGEHPDVDSTDLERLAAQPRFRFVELADKVLLYALSLEERKGALVSFDESAFQALAPTTHDKEIFQIRDYLVDEDFISVDIRNVGQIKFRPKGYIHCEQLQARQVASAQVFVAMWFDSSMTKAWNTGFVPAVEAAGYNALRVDGVEHNGKVDDRIIAEIRRSRFVVADFTGHRGGVYFEAGFALGLNLPVIWTCRNDHLNDLHFDIRQYNMIAWGEPLELARRLQHRIEATIGDGPQKVMRNGWEERLA